MRIEVIDYNGADTAIAGAYANEWTEQQQVLASMPLHLKASDQAGKQGQAIFDPVGTNEYIAQALTQPLPGLARVVERRADAVVGDPLQDGQAEELRPYSQLGSGCLSCTLARLRKD